MTDDVHDRAGAGASAAATTAPARTTSAAAATTATATATTESPARGERVDVLVLAGGISHERDVSMRSGRRVAEALRDRGLGVHVHDVDGELVAYLREARPDVVWPILHGATGEDGAIRDLLDILGLPYVGTGAAGSRVAWSKPIAKATVAAVGVATPSSVALPQELFRELGAKAVLRAVLERMPLPLVVKPATGGSALGVTKVTDEAQLPHAMVTCFAYGDTALIEQAATGIELGVSVVDLGDGPVALPAVEVVTVDGPYDYDARYNPGRSEYFVPARLDEEQARAAADVAVRAHRALNLRHISRTDLVLDEQGTPWFLEVNTAPGMTETSLFPLAAQATGRPLGDLYVAIVDAAVRDAARA
jgi:D-alanine-D-alanine ligase